MTRTVLRGFNRVALKRLRLEAKLGTAELARAVGVGRSTITRYEAEGGAQPSPAVLRALAEALKVAPAELLELTHSDVTLAELRYLAALSQEEVAEMLDLKRSSYGALERGAFGLSAAHASRLADVFGVSEEQVRVAHAHAAAANLKQAAAGYEELVKAGGKVK